MAITGCRNDELAVLLNSYGYQPLAMARSGFEAPYVYSFRDQDLKPVGPLSKYLLPGTPMPQLEQGFAPKINNAKTGKKSGSAIASFLGDALKVIGITSAPSIQGSLALGKDYVFNFDKVTAKGIPYVEVAALLQSVDEEKIETLLPPGDLKAGYVHIAYEFLYAKVLAVSASSGNSASFDVNGLAVQGVAELGARAKVRATSHDTLEFEGAGQERVAFACKIGWLEKRGKKLLFHIHEDEGESFLADEGEPKPYLLERGVVIRSEEAES